jgi:hypothetical protein
MPSQHSAARHRAAAPVPLAVRLLWLAADAILVLVALACALLLVVRFVAFPRIEAHREDIAAALGNRIGQPITIGAIVTGWDGWNPRLSIRDFAVVDRADRTLPVLTLPFMEFSVFQLVYFISGILALASVAVFWCMSRKDGSVCRT